MINININFLTQNITIYFDFIFANYPLFSFQHQVALASIDHLLPLELQQVSQSWVARWRFDWLYIWSHPISSGLHRCLRLGPSVAACLQLCSWLLQSIVPSLCTCSKCHFFTDLRLDFIAACHSSLERTVGISSRICQSQCRT